MEFDISKKAKTEQRETTSSRDETSSGGAVESRGIYARGERAGQRGALGGGELRFESSERKL